MPTEPQDSPVPQSTGLFCIRETHFKPARLGHSATSLWLSTPRRRAAQLFKRGTIWQNELFVR